MHKPSELDIRAAKFFQGLAASEKSISCRFRRVKPNSDRVEHLDWPRGEKEFTKHFGPPVRYFSGALEYIRATPGWIYPYDKLEVTVLKNGRHNSTGVAMGPGLHGAGIGEVRISWGDGEFTLTVLHELIHLFKKGSPEEWVEMQALMFTLGI